MDLGIAGRRALVCAASKGLGRACAMALAEKAWRWSSTPAAREALEATAAEIRAPARRPGDGRRRPTSRPPRAATRCSPPARQPDILVNNAGGPPPGDFRDWDREAWIKALDANMLTPIELIKATVDGMTGARLRPHRQHHLGRGQGADRHARASPTARAPGSPASSPGVARAVAGKA